jgi:hypothetical protein
LGDDEREAALLAEIERLLAARGLTAADLIEALKQLPVQHEAEALQRTFVDHQVELEALAAEHGLVAVATDDHGHLVVLPGDARQTDAVLDGYAAAAAVVLGHRPRVRYGSREPDGPAELVPGDIARSELHARFRLGNDGASLTCRGCMSRLSLDPGTGDWHGRHYRLCPTVASR